MKLGLDVFLENDYKQFKGQRIGLVTNMTGVNERLIPSIDLFHEHPEIELTALYAPEHGIRGDAKEGEKVESTIDPYTGLPVFSLYGATRKPTKDMLEPVDVLVFDLQDIGSRYYTFIYTMAYVMEACKENGKQFVVLDRPNPVSGTKMEGNLVEEDVRSFVGLLPIPNRHGMTVGEMALLYKEEFGYDCELTVVPMQGWQRDMYFDQTGLFWVPPSPNTTNMDMSILYSGTCLVEGTNLSEGRGTTRPFELVGAPFIESQQLAKVFNEKKVPGVLARPTSFIPFYQKQKDVTCGGIQLHVEDRDQLNSLEAGIILLETIAELYPNEFEFIKNENEKYFFDLLAGTKALKTMILEGKSREFLDSCNMSLESFQKLKEPYLLYK
ncbi:exo-beta-N-acetylmuramidase NamZ family protein [Ornithinibacillus halophilus]|uniref:Uncharacterized conserved protein YbbC, DUF1343 family n=1 Tax=Ornithinibacillus halophilus TaxID=930117 RepID=A0A1M5K284_9BACI|nr:DUF1343 domain-containing protein [Ornithinibacillus halophilus]SHG46907.1 Uncharacterized conserved protein YbbC, DUF1343 family [Ornithinibacillus halophilus]